MDYIMFKDFFGRLKRGEELPIDVYDAAAWMSITALSEQSIKEGGVMVDVPDFTRGAWKERKPMDVVKFPVVNDDKSKDNNSTETR